MSDAAVITKGAIARDWLPRYTGLGVDEFGDYVLLTNFKNYVDAFARRFDCEVKGMDRPMQAATNGAGVDHRQLRDRHGQRRNDHGSPHRTDA